MTEADHVKAIHVFTEKNPQPNVLSVHLGPRAGRARIATRARIADSGDGHRHRADVATARSGPTACRVIVTLSACLEEGLI